MASTITNSFYWPMFSDVPFQHWTAVANIMDIECFSMANEPFCWRAMPCSPVATRGAQVMLGMESWLGPCVVHDSSAYRGNRIDEELAENVGTRRKSFLLRQRLRRGVASVHFVDTVVAVF
jgi:hypothetical protein